MKNILKKSFPFISIYLIFKRRLIFKVTVLILLVSFAGCVTSKISYVEEDKLPKDKVYRIAEVYMKDGSIINLKDSEPMLKAKYKGIENVIVYYDNGYIERVINLNDVSKIKIEILESNALANVLIITGSVIAVVFICLLLFSDFSGLGPH